jgi:iron(III) transport system substrate-binding protein
MSEGFKKEYGIEASFVRLTSAALRQRFAAEATAANIAADLLIDTGAGGEQFTSEGIGKGWLQPVSDANLPILKGGGFPKQFIRGPAVIVQVSPWLIAYNTSKFKPGQAPKSWADLTNPLLKDQILFTSFSSASPSYMDLLELLYKQYGPDYLAKIRTLQPRWYQGGIPAMNGLGAGEGSVMFPATASMVMALKDKGAPVEAVQPDLTTGVEQVMLLSAPDKSKRPQAARLFANWIMSREGNKIVNADPGNVSVYDTANLPRSYQAPGTRENRDKILQLLDSK